MPGLFAWVAGSAGPGRVARDGAGHNSSFPRQLLRALFAPEEDALLMSPKVWRAVKRETLRMRRPRQRTAIASARISSVSRAFSCENSGEVLTV